jgi:hypothetical protein
MKKIHSRTVYGNLVFVVVVLASGYFYLSQSRYFSAPMDTPSHRPISLTASSNVEATIIPHAVGDAIYHIRFLLYISVDPALLNPNESENICIEPEVTFELLPNTRMSGDFLLNHSRIPEALWSRGMLRLDSSLVMGAIQAFHAMADTAVYQCFNVSNLAAGRHTVTFESSLETGESYSVWWQILIEG